MNLVVQALSGKLEDLSGKVLATAQGGAVVPPVPAGQAAPRTIHPAEISLLSAAVAEDVTDKNQPVHFFDWQRHADIFPVRPSRPSTRALVFADMVVTFSPSTERLEG